MKSSSKASIFQIPEKLSSTVTDHELKLFHHIDRVLFAALIHNLHRDPTESLEVMAFLMWLEQDVIKNLTLVKNILFLSNDTVNEIAAESAMCLRCVQNDAFPFAESKLQLYHLRTLIQKNITLRYFHQNRISVVMGVSKMIKEVCVRVFHDIIEKFGHGNKTEGFPAAMEGHSGVTKTGEAARGGGGGVIQRLGAGGGGGEISYTTEGFPAAMEGHSGVTKTGESARGGGGNVIQKPGAVPKISYKTEGFPADMGHSGVTKTGEAPRGGSVIQRPGGGGGGGDGSVGGGGISYFSDSFTVGSSSGTAMADQQALHLHGGGVSAAKSVTPSVTFRDDGGDHVLYFNNNIQVIGNCSNAMVGLPKVAYENRGNLYHTQAGQFYQPQAAAAAGASPNFQNWQPIFAMQPPIGFGVFSGHPPVLPGQRLVNKGYQTPLEPIQEHDAELDALNRDFKNFIDFADEEDELSPDERTIFLTFSKGYPITETELHEFFTKQFGGFIENIQMQEVPRGEQVLFARIVARSTGFVDAVVGNEKTKYNINGKHAWARRWKNKQKLPSISLSDVAGPSNIQYY